MTRSAAQPPPVEPPHAHLHRRALPLTHEAPRHRFLAVWSAVSASVMLAGVALVVVSPPIGVFWSSTGLMIIMLAVEAAARARLARFIATLAVTIAAVFAIWGAVEVAARNWRAGVAAVLILASSALLIGNLRGWLSAR